MVKGEPYFVGKDVAEILGYADTDQALRKHIDQEDKLIRQIDGLDQKRGMTVINESGLYSLILSSKLPKAKEFKRWVTADILPTIRLVRKVPKYSERWSELYKQFNMKYHMNVQQRAKSRNMKPLNYIENELGMLSELFDIACKPYESEVGSLVQEIYSLQAS